MAPTFNSEGVSWLRSVSGNFDDQGVSSGIIQWNIGQSTLQPLLRKVESEHPEVWGQAFRDGRAEQLSQNMDDFDWVASNVNQSDGHMRYEWAVDFDTLAATKEFRQVQMKALQAPGSYWNSAVERAKEWGITTERGMAAVFNATVQSGWFTSEPEPQAVWQDQLGISRGQFNSWAQFENAAIDSTNSWSDVEKVVLFRDVFSAQATPKWQQDVRSRFDKILIDENLTDQPWQ